MPKQNLAIVTMCYDEPDFLPIWVRYYSRHVPMEQLYIVDHGSDDGSTSGLAPANVLRVPRTALDEMQRCQFISEFCNSLLRWYDAVAYTDADELLVADPRHHGSLTDLARNTPHDVTTALGMHVAHHLPTEPPLFPLAPLTRQRHWGIGVGSMSKPILTRRPINWGPGFHYADDQTYLGDLFLFHIAYCDIPTARRRQLKRQGVSRANVESAHHGAGDEFIRHLEAWSDMPLIRAPDLGRDCPVRAEFTARLFATRGGGNGPRQIDATVGSAGLWEIPERFRDVF